MTSPRLTTTTVEHPPLRIVEAAMIDRRGSRGAVVVNPTKFAGEGELTRFRAVVDEEFARRGWLSPSWLPTTARTLGRAEAREAVSAGVDVVLVAGGDGTIRAAAQELAGTGIPLGLLPSGTGNLLARNLGVPLHDVQGAVRVACGGADGAVDVGRLELDRNGDGSLVEQHLFLVMAGTGFDAAMIGGASEELKRRLGQTAYVVSGVRALRGTRAEVTVRVDGRRGRRHHAHGVVFGNCGTLTMGLSLMPDADPGDGVLDGVVLAPQNAVQWLAAAWSVAVRSRREQEFLPRVRGRGIEVSSDTALPVQVDGDVVGTAQWIRVDVQPHALLVRRPHHAHTDRRVADRRTADSAAQLSLAS